MVKHKPIPNRQHPKVIRPLYIFILLVISTSVCVYALRQNNLTMVSLRQSVYQTDKDNGNVQLALEKLQSYVISHMNTSLTSSSNSVYPPIQLKYTYQRLVASASSSSSTTNTELYTQAEDYCQATIPTGFSGRYRVPCIENYVTTHKITSTNIPAGLYEFDFISPSWSPDLAGWSLVVSCLLVVALVISLIYSRLSRRRDKKAKAS